MPQKLAVAILIAFMTGTGHAETKVEKEETVEVVTPAPETPAPASENKRFAGAAVTLNSFTSTGVEDLEYDVDSQVWTQVEGSYKITKRLSASLNVKSDVKAVNDSFNLLGSLYGSQYIFSIGFGKLSGDATLSNEIIPESRTVTQTADDFEAKQLMIQFLNKEWALIDGSLFGFRYVQYSIPAEVEVNAKFGSSFLTNVEPFLDPDLEVKGIQFVLNLDTQRNYVNDGRGLPGSGMGFYGGMAFGFGRIAVSDQGKANIQSGGNKTLESDSDTVFMADSEASLYYQRNWSVDTMRFSFGAGYQARHSTVLSFSAFADIPEPENTNSGAALNAVRLGYLLHGPRLSFYGSW